MRVVFFDTHRFDREAFLLPAGASPQPLRFEFVENQLNEKTAAIAIGAAAICVFVNDSVDSQVVAQLAPAGLKLVALRCSGHNNVDLDACRAAGVQVVRVPGYSPYAVAEHALALQLCLNRKIHRAYARVRELNFSLDGLVGYDLNGKTVGVVGTGKIGSVFTRIVHGLGMRILAYDPRPNSELVENFGAAYVTLKELFSEADVIALQLPLNDGTRHIINAEAIANMKTGVVIVNTGRGGLIDTRALIAGLKSKKIGGAALDVYEEEDGVFFRDLSERGIDDDVLARLLTFPNVLVTAHQAFLTEEALQDIARATLANIAAFAAGLPLQNELTCR